MQKKSKDNITDLLNREDEFILLQIPGSKYMLVCKENPPKKWSIEMINPETNEHRTICHEEDGDIFKSLLFNIWSMNPTIRYKRR